MQFSHTSLQSAKKRWHGFGRAFSEFSGAGARVEFAESFVYDKMYLVLHVSPVKHSILTSALVFFVDLHCIS